MESKTENTTNEESTTSKHEYNKYRVVILNDDFTPFDFVVSVVVELFGISFSSAMAIADYVHRTGRGVCGLYESKDIADTKADEVMRYAVHFGHPLKTIVEKVDD